MNAAEHRGLRRVLAVVALVMLTAACATLPAPPGAVPPPDTAPQYVYGGWANVRHFVGKDNVTTSGELIAVEDDSVFVMTSRRIHAFAWNDVTRVEVTFFDPKVGATYGLGALGAISTLSHGYFFVFGFPIWLIIGSAAGAGRVSEAVERAPPENVAALRPYARFPQGMPGTSASLPLVSGGPEPVTASGAPADSASQRTRHTLPSRATSGLMGGLGVFEDGQSSWMLGFNWRIHREVFTLGGYTHFDDTNFDRDQLWAGLALGDPLFVGAKYIYTSVEGYNGHGISAFAGILVPAGGHFALGAMTGYDETNVDLPLDTNYWWASFVLQINVTK